MNKLLIALSLAGCLAAHPAIGAQDPQTTLSVYETNGKLTTLFKSIWAQLASISPRLQDGSAASNSVATAGVRGADDADAVLELYWKDDLHQDGDFQAELKRYNLGIDEMNRGQPHAAIESFDAFLAQYHDSSLRPNALLGKGISLAAAGENEQSRTILEQFVNEFPGHRMAPQAMSVIERLSDV